MNFAESESYLFSLGNEVLAMKLGLENIRRLLSELKDPHKKYFKVQIAGTNGKGSVCEFLDTICIAAGVRTGMTTSPHLISITERVKINGESIRKTEFARLATVIRDVSENLLALGELEFIPTYFEQVTAIALVAFAEAGVELAILETGLGGRLDATTACGAEIVGITQIAYDHQNILGSTLAQIAAEKAAIIDHSSQSIIIADQPAEAMSVITDRCEGFGIQPLLASEVILHSTAQGHLFRTRTAEYSISHLGLLGVHQIDNAKVAILLAESLPESFQVNRQAIATGLQNARHPGRIEIKGRFIFDGAHNVEGAKALRRFLDENIAAPITMVFGSMRDKDIREIAKTLFPLPEHIILTKPDNPRSALPLDLVTLVPEFAGKIVVTESVSEALSQACELRGLDEVILITGSLYLVGEAQEILNNQKYA